MAFPDPGDGRCKRTAEALEKCVGRSPQLPAGLWIAAGRKQRSEQIETPRNPARVLELFAQGHRLQCVCLRQIELPPDEAQAGNDRKGNGQAPGFTPLAKRGHRLLEELQGAIVFATNHRNISEDQERGPGRYGFLTAERGFPRRNRQRASLIELSARGYDAIAR